MAQTFTTARDLTINEQNGAFSTNFKVKKENWVVINFSAECLVTGSNNSYVDIDIAVRYEGTSTFVPLPPTSGDNSFCAPGTNTGSYWVSASTAGGAVMPVGNHTVKVIARPLGSVTSVRIDDLALYVID
ncbi:hypothetical protein [Chenggangzhangella methanolivorans]|uniref:Uncharacterized protein n=1 Tax=Chenggangzhangella methanolivorans TaxID=1437009 RepID=A0A9E6R7T0_9HYPH|nr:hypothetical protein [Chenggangzhangella methanolivorans]QZN99593.1 hypothetical protein K6K41_23300 [Chenggangzhangella methanolivorans]